MTEVQYHGRERSPTEKSVILAADLNLSVSLSLSLSSFSFQFQFLLLLFLNFWDAAI